MKIFLTPAKLRTREERTHAKSDEVAGKASLFDLMQPFRPFRPRFPSTGQPPAGMDSEHPRFAPGVHDIGIGKRRHGRIEVGSRPVSRILYPADGRAVAIHLGRTLLCASCGPPEPRAPRATASAPTWPCFGRGLPSQPVTGTAGGLLLHLFTLTRHQRAGAGRFPFLWHFPSGHPAWALPSSLPCEVRTFLRHRAPPAPATTRPTPRFPLYQLIPARRRAQPALPSFLSKPAVGTSRTAPAHRYHLAQTGPVLRSP